MTAPDLLPEPSVAGPPSTAGRPLVAVGAVAIQARCLLLVRRGHGPAAGTWSIPGGHVERGETLHEAVVRETVEETGLHVAVDHFLGWSERLDPAEDVHIVILDFEVTVLEPDDVPCPGDDAVEVAWVPFEDLSDYRLSPGLLDFLEDTAVLG